MAFQISNDPAQVVGGRGMVTTRPIQRGDLIHTENPLIIFPTGYTQNGWSNQDNITTFYAGQRIPGSSGSLPVLNGLTQQQRETIGTLSPQPGQGTPLDQAVDCFENNAFTFVAARNSKTHLVLYENISFINNSCVSNAALEIWPRRTTNWEGQARLVATRAISEGEEVFLNYIVDDYWRSDHVARNVELNRHWNFTCLCPGCTPPLNTMDTTSRSIAGEYHANIAAMATALAEEQKTHSIMHPENYIRILISLGLWDDKLSHACLELARLHFGKRDYPRATQAAIASVMVEGHSYSPTYSAQLNELHGKCLTHDQGLRDEYRKAAMGPYPM